MPKTGFTKERAQQISSSATLARRLLWSKSDEKTLADSLDYEKVETKKLREEKEALLKELQEANSATQKLQERINNDEVVTRLLQADINERISDAREASRASKAKDQEIEMLGSRLTEKETEIGKLQAMDQERSLLFNETARIAKENAEEIRTWKQLYDDAVATHKVEIEKLDSQLVDQVVENKRLLEASTCNIALLNDVLVQVRVHVSRDFLELVGKNVLSNRPGWRVNASAIDTSADSALLISDHSLFSGNPRGSSCIAVEIKAKCGFLPSSEYISKENSIKKQVTRYKMHQHLKFHQGEILKTSEYDPLDLFSGSKERIRMAIKSFFSTPQNNCRIFVNGSLDFGGMGGGADIVHPKETEKCVEDLSKVSGLQLSDFIELLSEAIFKSGVLGKLLATQKLDDHDIEGAIHLYYNIISQPCLVCKDITDTELLRKYNILHSLSLDKSQKIVRDFLISATVKDCSLMISFRPRESGTTDSEYDSVFLESVNRIYDYKTYFVDLDVKPLDKMVHYFKLDQKIVNFYTRSGEVGRHPCDSSKGGGTSDDTKIQLQH